MGYKLANKKKSGFRFDTKAVLTMWKTDYNGKNSSSSNNKTITTTKTRTTNQKEWCMNLTCVGPMWTRTILWLAVLSGFCKSSVVVIVVVLISTYDS